MTASTLRRLVLCLVPASLLWAAIPIHATRQQEPPAAPTSAPAEEAALQIHYLEIVTPDVDETCLSLEKQHGVTFGRPDAALGGARTAALQGGWLLGVRAPLRETETPVVRPYLLVDDIDAAVEAAAAAGGEVALPPMEMPGRGRFAIYVQGGIEHGLWEK